MKLPLKGALLLIFTLMLINFTSANIKPTALSCEYINNPLGIDMSTPRLSWMLAATGRNQQQLAYEIIVSDAETLTQKNIGNQWTTGKVTTDQNIHIPYKGKALKSFTRYYWKVRVYDQNNQVSAWSAPQWFETAMLRQTDWKSKWISDGSKQFEQDEDFYKEDPMPLFRKTFKAAKKISSARLYISGLGYFEAYINGKKVGNHVLDPGWSSFGKQVKYAVFDITAMLYQGSNAAGIMLGNGWYNPLPLRFWGGINMRNALVTGRPKVNAMIRIQYLDGTTAMVDTDESWFTAPGPVMRNNVYLGEHYDARKEIANWNLASAKNIGWKKAVLAMPPGGVLSAQLQPAVKVTKIVKPVSVKEVKKDVFVFDMGQNFAGVVRLKVKGNAGQRVVIRYGEDQYKDGSINVMTSVAGQIKSGNGGPGAPQVAWQEDSYTLKGRQLETWSPRFTFHGFRFVEVTGWPGKPSIADIEGLRLSADLIESGEFSSSNPLFNKLDTNIKWTFLSNVFSVQSDCPAREKLGYGGDLFCSAESFMYHYDMSNFYRKTVDDFVNDQQPLGAITETMPFVGIADAGPGDHSGPLGFQIGYPYLVKKLYDFYGDKQLIEDNYAALTRHVNFLTASTKDHLFNTDLGDHESLDDRGIPLTASIFYYLHVKLMTDFSEILGKKEETAKYQKLGAEIKQAIQQKFDADKNGVYEKGTQSTQIFALWSEIEKPEVNSKVFKALVDRFEQKGWHLSTGIFGTKMLFDVLRKADQNEMAYKIANQKDYPGWGYMIANGATTLWETWAESDNTYSKNHPMFGSVGEWFYRSLLGINHASAGFKKIVIKPQPVGDLTWAKGSFKSPYGKIISDWSIKNQQFVLNVEIPVNTTAEVWIPNGFGRQIKEQGLDISSVKDIKEVIKEKDHTVVKVGSGRYTFSTSK